MLSMHDEWCSELSMVSRENYCNILYIQYETFISFRIMVTKVNKSHHLGVNGDTSNKLSSSSELKSSKLFSSPSLIND